MLVLKYKYKDKGTYNLIKCCPSQSVVDASSLRDLLNKDGVPTESVTIRVFDDEDQGFALLEPDATWTVTPDSRVCVTCLVEPSQAHNPSTVSPLSSLGRESPPFSASVVSSEIDSVCVWDSEVLAPTSPASSIQSIPTFEKQPSNEHASPTCPPRSGGPKASALEPGPAPAPDYKIPSNGEFGSVWACGQGVLGLLRDSDTAAVELQNCRQPCQLQSLLNRKICRVACGYRHSLAVDVDGRVFSWGFGRHGELGHGNFQDIPAPKLVIGLENVVITSVASGSRHSLALTDKGAVYAWGCNDLGQLGRLPTGDSPPAKPEGSASLAIRVPSSSPAESRGRHPFSPSSPGSASSSAPMVNRGRPAALPALNLPPARDTSPVSSPRRAIGGFSLGSPRSQSPVKRAFSFKLPGSPRSQSPQRSGHSAGPAFLPSPAAFVGVSKPSLVPTLAHSVVEISCGCDHSAAVVAENASLAPAAVSSSPSSSCPRPVSAAAAAVCVAGSGAVARLYTWGQGQHGQLGHGDFASQSLPLPVAALGASSVTAVSCGGYHTSVLCCGNLVVFGVSLAPTDSVVKSDTKDQNLPRVVNELTNTATAVSSSHSQMLVLTRAQEVWWWGWQELEDGSKQWGSIQKVVVGKHVASVACGHNHCAAVTVGGHLYTWGRGQEGQLGHGSRDDCNTPKLVQHLAQRAFVRHVACGATHTMIVDDEFITQLGQYLASPLEGEKIAHLHSLLATRSLAHFKARLPSIQQALSHSAAASASKEGSVLGKMFKASSNVAMSLSKTTLTFGLGPDERCPVNQVMSDTLKLTNLSKTTKTRFSFAPTPFTSSYSLLFSPSTGFVEKGETITVQVELLARCSTQVNQVVVVEVFGGVNLFLFVELDTESMEQSFFKISWDELEILKCVAHGGSNAPVYSGMWRKTKVAVKHWENEISPESLAEFNQELSMMSLLRHPNLVLFMGACMQPSKQCIVTEWVPRGNLYSVLRDPNVRLPLPLLCSMMKDAALGVQYLHSLRVVHRDIKSGNYLVDDAFRVKLTDFGVARLLATSASTHEEGTAMTGMTGTVHYMAPEVMEHHRYSEKADVYGFGIVLWEMLTRSDPYPDQKLVNIIRDVCDHQKRPPLPPKCPAPLASLIQACWAQSPSDRPSFTAIIARLDEFIATLPPLPLPTSTSVVSLTPF